jgi:transcriptional regulator with GAF, ATPase, and Fis domain
MIQSVVGIGVRELTHMNMIGASPPFLRALDLIHRYADSAATVLIRGETGTGKELAARAVHYLSQRQAMPFVPVNCGAMPETLVESELFGHARGAFTDAREERPGLIQQAQGGTLFLDEIEAMPVRTQVVLLRFLQDREYRPIGGRVIENADVRIIGATNADLGAMTRTGTFRADLFFRLNVLPLEVPPLRERPGDVLLLAREFLDRLNRRSSRPAVVLDRNSEVVLGAYEWPGNVRELQNLIERRFLQDAGAPTLRISLGDLVPGGDGGGTNGEGDSGPDGVRSFKVAKTRAVAAFERRYLEDLLSRTAGNITLASRIAGKDRSDLGKLLRKHGIGSASRPDQRSSVNAPSAARR